MFQNKMNIEKLDFSLLGTSFPIFQVYSFQKLNIKQQKIAQPVNMHNPFNFFYSIKQRNSCMGAVVLPATQHLPMIHISPSLQC